MGQQRRRINRHFLLAFYGLSLGISLPFISQMSAAIAQNQYYKQDQHQSAMIVAFNAASSSHPAQISPEDVNQGQKAIFPPAPAPASVNDNDADNHHKEGDAIAPPFPRGREQQLQSQNVTPLNPNQPPIANQQNATNQHNPAISQTETWRSQSFEPNDGYGKFERAPLWPSVAAKHRLQEDAPWQTKNAQNKAAFNMLQQQVADLKKQVLFLQRRLEAVEFAQHQQAEKNTSERQQKKNLPPIFAPYSEDAPQKLEKSANAKRHMANAYQVPEDITADKLYQLGQDFMLRGQFHKAQKVWQAYLKRFKQDDRVAEISYLLGNSYYAQGLFGQAAEAYLDVRNYPQNAAIMPLNLLQLAKTMANLGDKQTACAVIHQLRDDYHDKITALLPEIDAARYHLQCL